MHVILVTLLLPNILWVFHRILAVALLTYAYASLRKYAAKTPGKYNGESAILRNEPVKAALVYGFVKDNIDILKTEEEFQGEDGLFALKQLLLLISNIDGTSNVNSGEVVVFNDKNPEQICYGITINRVDERIVVSFRGTQSFFDVIHDIKFSCQKVANPLYGQTKNQKRFIQNHKGFYGRSLNSLLELIFSFSFLSPYHCIVMACLINFYSISCVYINFPFLFLPDCLFQHKEDGKTKFQTIMDQLLSVVKENPDYKVYITGHRYVAPSPLKMMLFYLSLLSLSLKSKCSIIFFYCNKNCKKKSWGCLGHLIYFFCLHTTIFG